jgi:hypothetical protein
MVRVRLQANLVAEHSAGLTKGIDAAAQNNAVIRRGVEALTMGSAGWVLPAVLAVAPFAASSYALWRSDVTQEMAEAALKFETAVKETLGPSMSDGPPGPRRGPSRTTAA